MCPSCCSLALCPHSQPSTITACCFLPWLELRPPRLPGLLCFLLASRASAVRLPGDQEERYPGAVATAPAPVRVERDADVPGVAAKVPSSPPQAGVQAKPPFKPMTAGRTDILPQHARLPAPPQKGSLGDCSQAKCADV